MAKKNNAAYLAAMRDIREDLRKDHLSYINASLKQLKLRRLYEEEEGWY